MKLKDERNGIKICRQKMNPQMKQSLHLKIWNLMCHIQTGTVFIFVLKSDNRKNYGGHYFIVALPFFKTINFFRNVIFWCRKTREGFFWLPTNQFCRLQAKKTDFQRFTIDFKKGGLNWNFAIFCHSCLDFKYVTKALHKLIQKMEMDQKIVKPQKNRFGVSRGCHLNMEEWKHSVVHHSIILSQNSKSKY